MVSAALSLILVLITLAFPEASGVFYTELRSWVTTQFDFFFLISANIFIIFCCAIAISPFGRIRLGGDEARPEYRYTSWLAMLFAAGVGIGLMFYGVHEPVTHTLNPPLNIDPNNVEQASAAGMSAAIYHWGLHAWAIYAVVGLALAYFSFNRAMPMTLRSAFFPLLGKAVWGPVGHVIDIVAVLATIFGLATSLGIGSEQIAAGLSYLFDINSTNGTKVLLIIAIVSIALVSVISGLDKGVKRLSEINLALAFLLLLFVFFAGPTQVILVNFGSITLDYLYYLPSLSNWIGRTDDLFLHGWTTFYWAWWISWSPFVGIFIARISYGRSIREFVVWVLIIPTIIGLIWMGTLGGVALEQLLNLGYQGVAESPPELALFKMLEGLPFAQLVSGACVLLIALFFVTSADSGSLVVDTLTAGGKTDAPTRQRVFWCTTTGLVAIALMLGGGMNSLQALTTAIGLPFGLLLLLMCVSLVKGLQQEQPKQP
jgi:betaine/carnitine transporter, BCCT family